MVYPSKVIFNFKIRVKLNAEFRTLILIGTFDCLYILGGVCIYSCKKSKLVYQTDLHGKFEKNFL